MIQMANSLIITLAIASSMIFLCNLADASCRRHDRKCCREKIHPGSCHQYAKRWAYNVSCGRCVPFEYSGCGGDENNFNSFDECSDCCRGTPPCPRYNLPKPPNSCHYSWYDGQDSCQRPKLECSCPKTYCHPGACRSGHRCIPSPSHGPCNQCPCAQYRCISDPCHEVSKGLRPCEKCLSLPSPSCHNQPCPLIAYRENHCNQPYVPPYYSPLSLPFVPEFPLPPVPYYKHQELYYNKRPASNEYQESYYKRPRHCANYVECPPQGDSCYKRSCQAHPNARCISDPCDCQKHWWYNEGRTLFDEDCYGR